MPILLYSIMAYPADNGNVESDDYDIFSKNPEIAWKAVAGRLNPWAATAGKERLPVFHLSPRTARPASSFIA
jgi:hypothetical protein